MLQSLFVSFHVLFVAAYRFDKYCVDGTCSRSVGLTPHASALFETDQHNFSANGRFERKRFDNGDVIWAKRPEECDRDWNMQHVSRSTSHCHCFDCMASVKQSVETYDESGSLRQHGQMLLTMSPSAVQDAQHPWIPRCFGTCEQEARQRKRHSAKHIIGGGASFSTCPGFERAHQIATENHPYRERSYFEFCCEAYKCEVLFQTSLGDKCCRNEQTGESVWVYKEHLIRGRQCPKVKGNKFRHDKHGCGQENPSQILNSKQVLVEKGAQCCDRDWKRPLKFGAVKKLGMQINFTTGEIGGVSGIAASKGVQRGWFLKKVNGEQFEQNEKAKMRSMWDRATEKRKYALIFSGTPLWFTSKQLGSKATCPQGLKISSKCWSMKDFPKYAPEG